MKRHMYGWLPFALFLSWGMVGQALSGEAEKDKEIVQYDEGDPFAMAFTLQGMGADSATAKKLRHQLIELLMNRIPALKAEKAKGALDEKKSQLLDLYVTLLAQQEELSKANTANDVDAQLANAETLKKLNKRITFDFDQTRFSEAAVFIRKVSDVILIMDPVLPVDEIIITLKVQDMPISTALAWVCKMANARMELRQGAVFITRDLPPGQLKKMKKQGKPNEEPGPPKDGAPEKPNPKNMEREKDAF